MHSMKKTLLTILAFGLMISGLCACGSGGQESPQAAFTVPNIEIYIEDGPMTLDEAGAGFNFYGQVKQAISADPQILEIFPYSADWIKLQGIKEGITYIRIDVMLQDQIVTATLDVYVRSGARALNQFKMTDSSGKVKECYTWEDIRQATEDPDFNVEDYNNYFDVGERYQLIIRDQSLKEIDFSTVEVSAVTNFEDNRYDYPVEVPSEQLLKIDTDGGITFIGKGEGTITIRSKANQQDPGIIFNFISEFNDAPVEDALIQSLESENIQLIQHGTETMLLADDLREIRTVTLEAGINFEPYFSILPNLETLRYDFRLETGNPGITTLSSGFEILPVYEDVVFELGTMTVPEHLKRLEFCGDDRQQTIFEIKLVFEERYSDVTVMLDDFQLRNPDVCLDATKVGAQLILEFFGECSIKGVDGQDGQGPYDAMLGVIVTHGKNGTDGGRAIAAKDVIMTGEGKVNISGGAGGNGGGGEHGKDGATGTYNVDGGDGGNGMPGGNGGAGGVALTCANLQIMGKLEILIAGGNGGSGGDGGHGGSGGRGFNGLQTAERKHATDGGDGGHGGDGGNSGKPAYAIIFQPGSKLEIGADCAVTLQAGQALKAGNGGYSGKGGNGGNGANDAANADMWGGGNAGNGGNAGVGGKGGNSYYGLNPVSGIEISTQQVILIASLDGEPGTLGDVSSAGAKGKKGNGFMFSSAGVEGVHGVRPKAIDGYWYYGSTKTSYEAKDGELVSAA